MEMVKKVARELAEAFRFACSLNFWRMAIFWNLSLLISYSKLFIPTLFGRKPNSYPRCPPPQMPSSPSSPSPPLPLCIITGATSGLGAAAACALSKEGFYIVLAGRSPEKLSQTMAEIRQQNEDARLKAFQVDLSSFKSILKFVESLKQWLFDSDMHRSVQLLINNAGILATSFRLTADGYDQMMGTNYLGPFFLTTLLLPLLENSPIPSRIVNVSSFTHRSVFNMQINKDALAGICFFNSETYPCARIYEYSKLCLLLFAYELHRHLIFKDTYYQVSVNAVDPGAVETNLMRELPSYLSRMALLALRLIGQLQLPEKGVDSILAAALAPPNASGLYFCGREGKVINSSTLSYSTELAEALWVASSDMFQELSLAAQK